MSRRYGRNQKRKHVARIQELEADNSRMTRLWRSSVEDSENLRRQLDIVVSAVNKVCKNSGCVEAQYIRGLPANDIVRVQVWEQLEDSTFQKELPAIDKMTFKIVSLSKLALSIRKHRVDLSTKVHLRAGDHSSVYYYVSK